MEITLAIVNRSRTLSDADVLPVVAALQVQVNRDFAPAYGIGAALGFVPKSEHAPEEHWQQIIVDEGTDPAALGFHEVTALGWPVGYTSIDQTTKYGEKWSTTLSHELLELLADPYCFSLVYNPRRQEFVWLEVGDPCEAISYQIDGIDVSDFVLPAWFGAPRASKTDPFTHCGSINRAFALAPGGYVGVVSADGQVTQLTARRDEKQAEPREIPRPLSRRWRRIQLGGVALQHRLDTEEPRP